MRVALAAAAAAGSLITAAAGYVAHRIREDALRVKRTTPRYPMTVRSMSATEARPAPGGARVMPATPPAGMRTRASAPAVSRFLADLKLH